MKKWPFYGLSFFAAAPLFTARASGFVLKSESLKDKGTFADKYVFNGFGCKGKNISPPMRWENPPKGTKSFALTMFDPDAPTGSGWWHWTIVNIPASVSQLPEGAGNGDSSVAQAVQGRTDFGTTGYGGPCPPINDKPHRYIFTVYALDTPTLDLDGNSSGAMVGFMVRQHSLEEASLTGRHSRKD